MNASSTNASANVMVVGIFLQTHAWRNSGGATQQGRGGRPAPSEPRDPHLPLAPTPAPSVAFNKEIWCGGT